MSAIPKQFVRFCLIGVCNTLIDYLVYIFLTRVLFFYFLLANIISFILAATFSFFGNKYWTFEDYNENLKEQYLKFFSVSVMGLLINTLILFLLVNYAGIYDLWGKIIATAVVLFWNFGINRYWTFRQ